MSRYRAREQRLRRTVRRLAGCLADLGPRTRRVLVLRAARHSRAAVARRLELTVRRVTRIERRGLRRLRALDRTHSCAPPAPGAASPGGTSSSSPPPAGTQELISGDAPNGAGATGDPGGTSARPTGTKASSTGGVLGQSASRTSPATAIPIQRPGSSRSLAIMILALVIAAGAAALTARRELHRT